MKFNLLTPSDRRILSILVERGPLSRAELADLIGVSRPAVTQMISSLERFGLVEELESRKGARGQPARPVGIRTGAGYSAGVSFSHSYLDLAIIDLTGAVLDSCRLALDEPTPNAVACTATMALLEVRGRLGSFDGTFIGVGFALPGDFQVGTSMLIAHRYFPAFDRIDAQAFFQQHFDQPVFTENDGRTCAMGERLAGLGRGCRDFMLVHLGHGVGGGLFLDNRLYRGAHRNAGPLGTFFPMGAPRPSGQDLLETLRGQGIAAADFDILETLDPSAMPPLAAWCERAGKQLAPALQHVSDIIDPEMIIIGGRLPASILSAVVEATGLPDQPCPGRAAGAPPVVRASWLGAQAGAVGAASIPILDLLLP
ncbi:ROK family transcriptional regulator [Nitrospirillum sp. BR 11752]|uniref:ROK family transcriptional regulator n=1 Tax=Nitrospirillum sp. BR 11752 TaxID=3104293 RepID=UPI002E983F5F|nr:ROK family transcriptional regulator [Nitrospirillum sp. BR 11752]